MSIVIVSNNTPHMDYVAEMFARVYQYDAAEDGPEVEVITRILSGHWFTKLRKERKEYARE